MKSIFTFIIAAFLLFPLQAQEKVYTVDNLPKVHLQNKMQYVCNPAGILSQAACDSIDAMLYALEQQTGIETVVAVVPSIGETDCFDFCHQLLNKWGVGKKDKNNGLVILLVTDQRCIQFYTGYGLEGVLPDAICKRIQTKYMIPYLKDGNWDAGMVAGLKATCQRLDGSMAVSYTHLMVRAAESNPAIAIQYKMVDQWKEIAGEQVKAFEHMNLGNITVFDGGNGSTSNFLNTLVKTVAPSLGVLDKLPIGETVKGIIHPENKTEEKTEEKKEEKKK